VGILSMNMTAVRPVRKEEQTMKIRWTAAVLAALFCLCCLPCIHTEAEDEGTMTSPAIETLRGLGFTLDDATLNKAAEYVKSLADIQTMDTVSLLYLLGLGIEHQDGEWEPISHDILILDAEVTFVDLMYTNILKGINAIVPCIEITDIREDLSKMTDEMVQDKENPWMMTDGTRSVSFLCNGHPYSIELTSYGDWVNEAFFTFMDKVLEKENCPDKLYQITVLYQYVAMVYGPYERAEKIHAILVPSPV